MSRRTRLLIVAGTYEPGWKAGGPVQSLVNLVELLHNRFDIYVLTRDRDHMETHPYAGIQSDTWIQRDGAQVYYASSSNSGHLALRRAFLRVSPDTLYLTSFMSSLTRRFLALSTAGLINPRRIVLAPQGELAHAAMANKPLRKRGYLIAAQLSGAVSRATWQASAEHEAEDIGRVLRHPDTIVTIPDVVERPDERHLRRSKKRGVASFVCVARISPIKNIVWLVKLFTSVNAPVALRLVGPREPAYWHEVAEAIDLLPGNVSLDYLGPIPPSEVAEILASSDFFILPTLSENFGHAIYESLRAGRPALISDRTPWSVVREANAGWVMDPTDVHAWTQAILACVSMSGDTYVELANSALALAQEWYTAQDYERRYARLLDPRCEQT